MAGGPPAGVFGIFATGIGTYLSKNVPNLDVSVAATGGSVENTRRINGKDAEMGLSFSSDVHEAFHGLEKFTGQTFNRYSRHRVGLIRRRPFDHLRGKRHPHREELAGKRVAVGNPGVRNFLHAERVFRPSASGTKSTEFNSSAPAAGEAMAEGKADAFFWTGPEPDRVTMETATKKPVRAIDIYTPVSKTDFFKQYPYFARYVFPANSYRGITEDTSTVGVPVIWYANKASYSPLIQKMAAAAYSKEGNAHMMNVHAGSKDMVPQKALQGVTFPLHKGAEEHWKAAGIQIPEAIRSK